MLIHGDNTGQSRNYYLEIRNKYKNQKLINGDKLTMTELVEAVEGDGLFSINEAVFVEQFLSKNKIGKDFDALLDYLNQEHEIAVILWESKEIDKKQIAKLKKATTKLFSYPKTLFQLLDACLKVFELFLIKRCNLSPMIVCSLTIRRAVERNLSMTGLH